MARTVACPGSVQLQERYPEQEQSEAAAEGTRAHSVLAAMLTGNWQQVDFEPTEEMREGAQLAVDHVLSITRGAYPVVVEQRVNMFGIHADNWGTPDMRAWIDTTDFHVWDYKFGHGFVDAFENWQCIDYTVGAIEEAVQQRGYKPSPDLRIHIHVIQPRNYDRSGPVRTWTTTLGQLAPYVDRIIAACKEASEVNPRLMPGRHCGDCAARIGCEALHKAVMWDSVVIFGVRPLQMTPHDVGVDLLFLMRMQDRINALVDARSEQAERLLRVGTQVPFFTIEEGNSREKWTIPAQQVFAAGDLLKIDLRKAPEPITPTQARAKGFALAGLFAKRDKTTKLAAVNTDAARKIFQPKE